MTNISHVENPSQTIGKVAIGLGTMLKLGAILKEFWHGFYWRFILSITVTWSFQINIKSFW